MPFQTYVRANSAVSELDEPDVQVIQRPAAVAGQATEPSEIRRRRPAVAKLSAACCARAPLGRARRASAAGQRSGAGAPPPQGGPACSLGTPSATPPPVRAAALNER